MTSQDKPLLLIGLDPNMNAEGVQRVIEQLREQLPDFFVVVIAGMRYATVLPRDGEGARP